MSEAFEWFDPYEQKARADREERRANAGVRTGRQQVEAAIARAMRDHLSEKLEMAVTGLADRIARRVMFDYAARAAHQYMAEERGQAVAAALRRACMEVVHGLELPEKARVRAIVSADLETAEETLTLQFETLEPIRIAHAIRL